MDACLRCADLEKQLAEKDEAIKTALADKDIQIMELRAEAAALREQVDLWKAEVIKRNDEIAALRQRVAELTSAYSVRNDEVTGLQGMLAEAKAEAAALREKVSELEYYKKLAMELDDKDDRRLQAARVEGLREAVHVVEKYRDNESDAWARRHFHACVAAIAALERGGKE